MNLSSMVREECVQVGDGHADKASVLKSIVTLAKKCPVLADVPDQEIFEALQQREDEGSTGFGNGIAIPHCKLDSVPEFVIGILTAPDGIDFDSLDGQKTTLLVFIIGPATQVNRHISLLAAVSHILRRQEARAELIAETNPVAIRESFLRYSMDNIDTGKETESCLFHVFVENEDVFHDILQVFAEMQSCMVSVVEGKDAGSFLHELPLFSSFWREDGQGFNRIILAVVKKALTNECVRQINDIAGGLNKTTGVMITVQQIFFSAGSLGQ